MNLIFNAGSAKNTKKW